MNNSIDHDHPSPSKKSPINVDLDPVMKQKLQINSKFFNKRDKSRHSKNDSTNQKGKYKFKVEICNYDISFTGIENQSLFSN